MPDGGHTTKARESPCQKENDELCHKKRYGKGHHKLLHMIGGGDEGESSGPRVPCSVPELNQHETGPVLCGSGTAVRAPIQLMTRWIKDRGGCSCLTFWDLGSQVTLVTTQYAREKKLPEVGSSSVRLSELGGRTNPGGLCPIQCNPIEHGRPSRGSDCL
jgi:hypothetical protein